MMSRVRVRIRAFLASALFVLPATPAVAQPASEALSDAAAQPPLVIALGSCNGQEQDQGYWDVIAETAPDLFLFLGDNVYGDRVVDGERQSSPDLLRSAYDRFAQSEPYARFSRSVPVYPVWDDHDYGVNDAGADHPFKDQAKQIFLDFFDFAEAAQLADRDGVYYAIERQHGAHRVQILMLDTRWNRSALARTEGWIEGRLGAYVADPDPAKTVLGAQQEAWLAEQLARPADLRVIASSIQVIAEGHHFERWGNLPAARQRLYDLIDRSGAENVVLVSGDRHAGGLYRLDGAAAYPLYELTSSSLNRGRAADPDDEFGPHQMTRLYGPENFGLITVDWAAGVVSLDLHDAGHGRRVRGLTVPLADLTAGR
ncbi:alkaline phosphatase D [Rhodothalassium salexigens DSM 2132]|uniref:Alkaline phosphatase D n=1 Tax=Rhodothalassium salexigens DSM 2132 TaxID=1188247 RepID=A0A4R2P7I6_RHOSA|nr:alkaline phosphatase D family protein [Rhodothalassium salexigens]MBB4212743.1 alkaline phosphatase D [Rhodothalassium salexigens DSM 2132]TCP30154.1 alkaline phosphatase D [Rhodothalassium salexigens DSM 2132]